MHSLTFSEIAAILKVKPLQLHSDPVIESLLTDSRKLLIPTGTLFFAIDGPQKTAGNFIPLLYEKSVRCFITGNNFSVNEMERFPEGNFIQTTNVLEALQEITSHHRHGFRYPVIGITGSNGKTILKEWLYQLLSNDYNIIRNPKSYNSQIGVPLSVWNMNESHTLGIFEAGISLPGEMQRLQKIIDPEIGVFTYIGDAHSEGFKDIQQKINEKLQLFIHSKIIIYCADDDALHESVNAFKKSVNNNIRLFGLRRCWSSRRVCRSTSRRCCSLARRSSCSWMDCGC